MRRRSFLASLAAAAGVAAVPVASGAPATQALTFDDHGDFRFAHDTGDFELEYHDGTKWVPLQLPALIPV